MSETPRTERDAFINIKTDSRNWHSKLRARSKISFNGWYNSGCYLFRYGSCIIIILMDLIALFLKRNIKTYILDFKVLYLNIVRSFTAAIELGHQWKYPLQCS